MNSEYIYILKRAGIVMYIAGAIYIAITIYGSMEFDLRSWSVNLAVLAPGYFLYQGKISDVAYIKRLAAVVLPGFIFGAMLQPIYFPWDLILTEFRFETGRSFLMLYEELSPAFLLVWLIAELSRSEIVEAQRNAGIKIPHIKSFLALGAALVSAGVLLNYFDSTTKYEKEAEARAIKLMPLGEYKSKTADIDFVIKEGETRISAMVIIWNHDLIDRVHVSWRE